MLDRLGSVRPSQRLTRDADALRVFRNAYVELINNARLINDGFDSYLGAGTDNRTWQRKRTTVATAAGAAGGAYSRHGGTMTLRKSAYIMRDIDPLANWDMSLHDPANLTPETIIASVDSAIARADQLAKEAAERERGLTGLIAAFLRWPSNLREAVGPEQSVQRAAAGVIGVVGQVVVGAFTTALTAGLVSGAVAIWQHLF